MISYRDAATAAPRALSMPILSGISRGPGRRHFAVAGARHVRENSREQGMLTIVCRETMICRSAGSFFKNPILSDE